MKRTMAMILTILCVALAGALPGAAEATDEHSRLESLLLEYKEDLCPGLVVSIGVVQFENYDDVTIFTAYCEYNDGVYDASGYSATTSDGIENRVGRYLIKTSYVSDNVLSIFALANGEVMTFAQAFENGMVSIEMLDKFDGVEYLDIYGVNGNGKYEAVFVERLNLHYSDLGYSPVYGYEELYFHYAESATADESEPEYALVMAHNGALAFSTTPYYWGDWVYFDFNSYLPGGVPYYIYVPAEDKIYTVEEAVNAGMKDIDVALKKIKCCALLGDVDGNYILNIKDATEIQKFVAGLDSALSSEVFSELMNIVANFTRDVSWTVNVKDATAIQKHIAGLE